MNITQTNDFAVPNGLVGYWGLDIDCWDPVNIVAKDLVGKNNLSNVANSVFVSNGQIGGAAQFPGGRGSGLKNLSCVGLPTGAAPISISSWFKLNSTDMSPDGYMEVVCVGDNSGSYKRFATYIDPIQIGAEFSAVGMTTSWTPNLLVHHLVITYNGGANNANTAVYLDGQRKPINGGLTGDATSLNYVGSKCVVGALNIEGEWGTVGDINGWVDDVRIYNRALDATEVFELYITGLARQRNNINNILQFLPITAATIAGLSQTHFRFRTDTNAVDANPTWGANEDTDGYNPDVNKFRIRAKIEKVT